MEHTIYYILATISILVGTAGLYMPLMEIFPAKWQYYHYFVRKPINWTILLLLILWTILIAYQQMSFPFWTIVPLIITGLALLLSYKMHQEVIFDAVDYPTMTNNSSNLPLKDDMQLAVIEYNGITKYYPLDYVVHHHIINDHFNEKIVSLTYCAMCRSIIPFDVTELGPLFVGSFNQGNMIVADRKTKTFFQQASFQSIIGKLHPSSLTMIPFQIQNWAEVKKLSPSPTVVAVTAQDIRQFELPIPGVWKKIINSELVPGLSSKNRDHSLPTRTFVVGLTDKTLKNQYVYIKNEVLQKKLVQNNENKFILIGLNNIVNAFKIPENNSEYKFALKNNQLYDENSETLWSSSGKYISGEIKIQLEPLAFSDEYWFSWKKYHPESQLIRL